MNSASLLREISDYCRNAGLAESTFGRLAVNDGKLVSRLRFGGRVTTRTVDRLHGFMAIEPGVAPRKIGALRQPSPASVIDGPITDGPITDGPVIDGPVTDGQVANGQAAAATARNFRFYDNRQKYLLFVTTCSEKSAVAERVGMELANIHPRPPAVRVFDAGVGDGTVLARVMRSMHTRFSTMPFYIVAKEISLEDVRLTLEKMADRFFEHPSTVLVLTNMHYSEAPWLAPKSVTAATSLVWHELSMTGNTSHAFEEQITALQPFLAQHWHTKASPATGNPMYEKPVVLVIYRDDHAFMLDRVRPRRGAARADYDLLIASQPYRARASVEFKAAKVLAPLARSLGPGGRLIGIQSHGNDPGMEIIRTIWPGEDPFTIDRHQLLRATRLELGVAGRNLNFSAYADARSMFRYHMHALPSEIGDSIGTSTLFAAWNAAIYVAQIEDQRLSEAIAGGAYLDATKQTLRRHGGLWFWDESFVISRRRDFK